MRARSCSLVFLTIAVTASVWAEPQFRHGVTNFVDLKHAEGFPHFDYVNPDAPKGGTLVLATAQNFNSFTPIIDKGIRPPGIHVIELAMVYDPCSGRPTTSRAASTATSSKRSRWRTTIRGRSSACARKRAGTTARPSRPAT